MNRITRTLLAAALFVPSFVQPVYAVERDDTSDSTDVAQDFSADPASFEWETGMAANAGDGDFAPYFIASNRHDVLSQGRGIQAMASISHRMDLNRRFSFSYGLSLYGGWQSNVQYERYSTETGEFFYHPEHPSRFRVQNLYAEIKYRGFFLSVGQKERGSQLFNSRLGSGDFIESGNARPIPQVRVGFVDFQNIPFTKGALQLRGEVAYGALNDNGWWRDHYNYYNQHIGEDILYMYRCIYFRTDPRQPLSVTFGAQSAAQFGGTDRMYFKGKIQMTTHRNTKPLDFLKIFFPFGQNDEQYYLGNTLGSWDLQARYRIGDASTVKAYFQWPWEDGSGIGKLNGFDGIWGLEYHTGHRGPLTGIVVEYIDFTNQSGPIHWAPGDHPGTTITSPATGSDDYYNNKSYNSYAYFGMNIGTPVIMSPIYNTDGYMLCRANRLRAFHLGVEGAFSRHMDYRLLLNYRKAYGNGYYNFMAPIHQTSVMAEVRWRVPKAKGLSIDAAVGLDRGKLPANAFGAMVGIRYQGIGSFKKQSAFKQK